MHVAKTVREYKGKVYTNYLIRTSYRENGKVKHKTLANISRLPADLIEICTQRLKSGKPLAVSNGISIKRSLLHGHVAVILSEMQTIDLPGLLAAKRTRQRDLIMALIAMRLISPGSKLYSKRLLARNTAVTTLGQLLWVDDLTRDEIYSALDWLLENKQRIEKKLAAKHLQNGSIILYDLSSSYYTGKQSNLVQFGHNRDGKKGFAQIVYGILCNSEGCPVAVEVFKGNTSDSSTLSAQIAKVRNQFGIERVVWVGDRGMITGKFIDEQLRDDPQLDWITALRSVQIDSLVNQGAIQLGLFDKQDMAEIQSDDYPGERLIVCRNPFLAHERGQKRNALLTSTIKELEKIKTATQRKIKPLRGKDKIGLRVGKVINKFKVAKHFVLHISDESFEYELDNQNIAKEAALDGIYVIRTSALPDFSTRQLVQTYKNLSHVEQAFRTVKTTRLQVRPIYHRNDQRIEAHIFLCMLAYYIEWHLRQKLAPMLYVDPYKAQTKAQRKSVVEPVKKSKQAANKASTHLTSSGLDVHDMDSILAFLGTICKNEVQFNDSEPTFYVITEPTYEQQQILDLLDVKL